MSFDVYLLRFKDGKPVELEREPARRVLEAHRYDDYHDGCFDVRFTDGSHVEFSGEGLTTGDTSECWVFYLRNMTPAVVGFVFDIALAADAVMFAPIKGAPAILVRPEQRPHLPAAVSDLVVECPAADKLHQLFSGDYEAWREYRDYIAQQFGDAKT